MDDDVEKLEQKSDELRKEGTKPGRTGKGVLMNFIISKLISSSYISRHSNSTEFASLSTLDALGRANELSQHFGIYFFLSPYETALNTVSYPFSHITLFLLPKLSWRMFLSPLPRIV